MWMSILSSLLGSQGAQGMAGQMGQAAQGGMFGGNTPSADPGMGMSGGQSMDPMGMTPQTPGAPATPGAPQTPGVNQPTGDFGMGMQGPDMSHMMQNLPSHTATGPIGLESQAQQLTPQPQSDPVSFNEFIRLENEGGVLPPKPGPEGSPNGGWTDVPSFAQQGGMPPAGNEFAGLPPTGGSPMTPVGGQQQAQGQQSPDTNQLFSLIGTPQNPNTLVKLAEGYNRGGLLGALGYGLTRF